MQTQDYLRFHKNALTQVLSILSHVDARCFSPFQDRVDKYLFPFKDPLPVKICPGPHNQISSISSGVSFQHHPIYKNLHYLLNSLQGSQPADKFGILLFQSKSQFFITILVRTGSFQYPKETDTALRSALWLVQWLFASCLTLKHT